jgi:hypothetical protein
VELGSHIAIVGLASLIAFAALFVVADYLSNGPPYAPINSCINNLRQLDAAKQQWASEHSKEGTNLVSFDDIKPCPPQGLEAEVSSLGNL